MEITVRKILLSFASILGIASIITFISTDLFTSPLTTTSILLLVGVGLFVGTKYSTDKPAELATSILGGFAIIVGSLYSVATLASGPIMITLSLVILSVIFGFAAYITQTDKQLVTTKQVKILFLLISIITISLIVVDTTTGDLQNEVIFYENIQIENDEYGQEYIIGEVTVSTQTPLPQRIGYDNAVRYEACVTGINTSTIANSSAEEEEMNAMLSNIQFRYNSPNQILYNSYTSKLEFPSYAVDVIQMADVTISSVPVETSETCPESTDEPTITILT